MESKMSIKQIAELAGVSVATVSRVINQNGRFSAETEARVKQVIQESGYVPNVVAKGLRTNRTQVIGVIVPDIVNDHFAKLVLEIEKELFKNGYSTVICNTNESKELEKMHLQTLVSQQVSGIIFISGNRSYSVGDIPVIYVDRRPYDFQQSSDTIVIESDNEQGGYLAARELFEAGCLRPVILRALHRDYNQSARFEGYQRALRERGIEYTPSMAIDLPEVSFAVAKAAVRQAVLAKKEFDGILCTTDILAIGAVNGLKEAGRSVPKDVKITGFDDSNLAAIYNPTITSVHQYVNEMAKEAVDTILALIDGMARGVGYRKVPVQIIPRESTQG